MSGVPKAKQIERRKTLDTASLLMELMNISCRGVIESSEIVSRINGG